MERKNQKSKKNEAKTQSHLATSETYFRLCHFCFHLNESDQPILECMRCSNLLSSEPIEEFYEDLYAAKKTATDVDSEEDDPESNQQVLPQLGGLSVIW